jgi:hypothetical protein
MSLNVANIKRVLAQADRVDWNEGMIAYQMYNQTMSSLAQYYGYSLETVTAVFAALSPNNDYLKNLRSTVTLLKGFRDGHSVDSLTVTTYNACKLRAWRVLNGESFLSFTTGKKTRNFYECIINPEHQTAITIDGHATNIWLDKPQTMTAALLARIKYDAVAHDYRKVAFENFMLPMQLQAITWFTWKRINNIVYKPQMDFDLIDNVWKLKWEAEEIKPYYI